MAFGVKVKTVKTKEKYTVDSFFAAIKDKEFTAGKPQLTKHGLANIITFPALDSQNQVWILASGFGKETNKWSVQKSQEAGLGNTAKNAAMDSLTHGVFGMKGVFGGNAKECEKLVEATAKELSEMGL